MKKWSWVENYNDNVGLLARSGRLFFGLLLCTTVVLQLLVSISWVWSGPVGHDELVYLIKSWWLMVGQLDWYSDTGPLNYFPFAYLNPGIAQWLFGQGLIEGRLPGFLSAVLTIPLVYIFCRRTFDPYVGISAVLILGAGSCFYSFSSVSTYGFSNLLIVMALIASSDKFCQKESYRVTLCTAVLTILLFTRLNHVLTFAVLLPVFAFNTKPASFRAAILILVGVMICGTVVVHLLPADFLEVLSYGIFQFLSHISPFLEIPREPFSESLLQRLAEQDVGGPAASSSAALFKDVPDSGSFTAVLLNVWPDLYYACKSLVENMGDLLWRYGVVLVGLGCALAITWVRKVDAVVFFLATGFCLIVGISFLKGYSICKSCPLNYIGYFFIPGVIAAAYGFSRLSKQAIVKNTIIVVLAFVCFFFSYQSYIELDEHRFTAREKAEVAQLALEISEIVPNGNKVLLMGPLGHPHPLRLGTYMADRFFEPTQIAPMFTFRSVPLDIVIPDADLQRFAARGGWTPHHLLRWIKEEYEYIIKPTHLYFDDHRYRYWFRNLYFPAVARVRISENFLCNRIKGEYRVIPPIDICIRKTSG